jgi:endogenous inhibitor of DNA gyrase (YacG/DUF329 family)
MSNPNPNPGRARAGDGRALKDAPVLTPALSSRATRRRSTPICASRCIEIDIDALGTGPRLADGAGLDGPMAGCRRWVDQQAGPGRQILGHNAFERHAALQRPSVMAAVHRQRCARIDLGAAYRRRIDAEAIDLITP